MRVTLSCFSESSTGPISTTSVIHTRFEQMNQGVIIRDIAIRQSTITVHAYIFEQNKPIRFGAQRVSGCV